MLLKVWDRGYLDRWMGFFVDLVHLVQSRTQTSILAMSALNEKKQAQADTDATPKDVGGSPSSGSLAETVGINEKALLRKLDYRLLPPLTLLYLLSFLDRSNGSLLSSRWNPRASDTDNNV